MKVTKKEVRNQEPKKGFIATWDEMWQKIRQAIVPILYVIITIPAFFVISYCICWQLMGEDLCSYDKEVYENIRSAVADNIIVVDDAEGEPDAIKGFINSDGILDTVDTCQSARGNGEKILECTVQKGYFKAIVTTRVSEDFEIIAATQNYNSEKEYMDGQQPFFILCVIGGAVVGWLVITTFVCLLIQVLVWIGKSFKEKKANKEEADKTDSKETKASLNNKETDDFDLVDEIVNLDDETADGTTEESSETSKEVPKTS